MLQVCLHTAKHSYCRAPGFRLHSDVDRIVIYQEVDWKSFVKKVKELHLKTAVYFSLFFAHELLKTPIPASVLTELEPSAPKRKLILTFINKAGLFGQNKSKFSKLGYIVFGLLLFDNIAEVMTAIVPSKHEIKRKYNFSNNLLLPFFYLVRIKELLFKRAKL